ncbi:hypothetical protein PR002_g15872 [Phytophthora rubi]|uniref:Putative auto-transporter adhesin head GIN domain-containing protein n=1 Tax=Phytophthora rubi TaxID=129364 RepID=A0A6A3KM96_9STRA|nr:hypothetical protein PR002_g15872 [Phytophthora rubi]
MDDVVFVDAAPYWTVHCTPGGRLCEQDQAFVVTVTGSYDVVLRYEALDSVGDGDVARVRVKGSSSSEPQNVAAQLLVIDGLPVLEISATEEKLDVLLLRKQRVQRVINQGSGGVSIGDNVFATGGPSLTIGAVGSGDVTLSTSSPVTVDELTLSAQGSGHLQGSFSEFDVKTLRLAVTSSGGATVLAGSNGTADSLALTVQGSGSLCLSAGGLLETNRLKIKKIGSGDVSLGPRGSCQNAEVDVGGSGTIDVGGVECHSVNVDLLGSGNVVVQATDSLSGDVYGSGHLHYFGTAPRSIDNVNYMGLVVATPTSSSYHPSGCKAKPFPSLVSIATTTNSSNQSDGSGASDEFRYDLTIDQSNIVYLAGVVFLVGLCGDIALWALNRVYYKDALGALRVYDMSRPETFDSILKKKKIDSKMELPNGEPLPAILCENKCDLKEDVARDFLDEFCKTSNFTGWFDTSAKETSTSTMLRSDRRQRSTTTLSARRVLPTKATQTSPAGAAIFSNLP